MKTFLSKKYGNYIRTHKRMEINIYPQYITLRDVLSLPSILI